MVKVLVARGGDDAIRMFEVSGHAGYDTPGRDVVCAAASVTAYNTVGALGELAGVTDCYFEKPGYMKIELPGYIEATKRHTVQTIMDTAYIGFKQIEGSYPSHLSVDEVFRDI